MDYKTSGVDVKAGRIFVDEIRSSVEETHSKDVIGGLGGFGGVIRIPKGFAQPVLVSATDGVGTKLELAQSQKTHKYVGIDLVAMCVNDVITSGARPLLFLDYIATGVLEGDAMREVVQGIAKGCNIANCSLLGGETAEMPGFYPNGRYDLAGFCVGVAEEANLIDGQNIAKGDQIVGIASNGVHSNGFSLVRKVFQMNSVNSNTLFGSNNKSLIDDVLKPTNIYVQLVNELLINKLPIKGMAHITGGGLPENLPRSLPKGFSAVIDKTAWEKPEIFSWLQNAGDIPEVDLWNTFNMGIGFCLILPPAMIDGALEVCRAKDFDAWIIGEVDDSTDPLSNGIIGLPS